MCRYIVDQHLIVLNLYNVLINKILVLKFMAVKVSQNLNSMQKSSAQWNQQLFRFVFSKVIEYLGISGTRKNTECSKTNRLKSPITEQMSRAQNIWMKVRKCKSAVCLEIQIEFIFI